MSLSLEQTILRIGHGSSCARASRCWQRVPTLTKTLLFLKVGNVIFIQHNFL